MSLLAQALRDSQLFSLAFSECGGMIVVVTFTSLLPPPVFYSTVVLVGQHWGDKMSGESLLDVNPSVCVYISIYEIYYIFYMYTHIYTI